MAKIKAKGISKSTGKKTATSSAKTIFEAYIEADRALASTPINPALKSFFGYCLYRAAQRMRGLFNEKLSRYGIATPHFGILWMIDNAGSLSQISLGTEMGIDKASMVKLIDDLESLGWVMRTNCGKDRRIKYVDITDKGKKAMEGLVKTRSECETEFLKDLDADERTMIKKIIPKLVK